MLQDNIIVLLLVLQDQKHQLQTGCMGSVVSFHLLDFVIPLGSGRL